MKTIKSLFLMMLMLSGTHAFAQGNACEGSSTVASEGSFNLGYNYSFTTVGTDVVIEFQLLDPQVGLVAFAQTFNPDFAESPPMTVIGDPAAQTFGITFTDQTPGDTFNMRCKFAFAGGLATTAIISYVVDEGCAPGPEPSDIELPITFEDGAIDYELQDFGDASSVLVPDPEDPGNTVVETTKLATAADFAGTTVADVSGFTDPIPFEPGSTEMTVRVWSPTAGIPVRLKVEQVGAPAISVETEAMTTTSEEWETLTFDFVNQALGTAPISFGANYNKASIFFNFGTPGSVDGEKVYYWDDVTFVPGDPIVLIDLPVTFEDGTLDYGLTDNGGAASSLVPDPENPGNTVVQTIRMENADSFASTTLGGAFGFANPIPFELGSTKLSVRIYSPSVGVNVRLKAENALNPVISVETESTTTVGGAWETIEFNFSDEVAGTPPINFVNDYSKVTIFFNFGAENAPEQTYFWDDVEFVPGGPVELLDLPVDFENDDINYGFVDFAGATSSRTDDPEDPGNTVVQTIRGAGAAPFAGTLLGEGVGFANPLAFTESSTVITIRVWSPEAGIPVRVKAEALTNPAIFVETETNTTTSEEWETMEFDFSEQVTGTPPLDLNNVYEKLVVFFNFGATGVDAVEQTFYWDDVQFAEGEPVCEADGGTLTAESPRSVCVGTGSSQGVNISVSGASGTNQRWGLLDSDGNILDTRIANSLFNLDGYAPGDYTIRYIRYEDDVSLSGLTNASQLASLEGCWDASNPITVFLRPEPNGGTLTALSPTTVCASGGSSTGIAVELTGATGENSRFGLVNVSAPGNPIVATQNGTTFNLNPFPAGTYQVRHLAYQTGVVLSSSIEFQSELEGCFDISNGVTVSIVNCGATISSSPNPASHHSNVTFTNERAEYTTLEVYDLSGRMVERIFNQVTNPGQAYRLQFDGSALPNGVYMYRLTTESETLIDKFMIAR